MFLIIPGFYKPKLNNGKLFGKHDNFPLFTVNLIFFQIVVPTGETKSLFRKALSGLLKDDDWHITNAPSVRLAKKKARSKCYIEARDNEASTLNDWKKSCRSANKDLRNAKRTIQELETTVNTLRYLNT